MLQAWRVCALAARRGLACYVQTRPAPYLTGDAPHSLATNGGRVEFEGQVAVAVPRPVDTHVLLPCVTGKDVRKNSPSLGLF